MKPHRVRMAHHLIVTYGLYKYMDVFRPPLIKQAELTKFHSDDYVNFLRMVSPDNMQQYVRQLQRCKFLVGLRTSCAHYVYSQRWGGLSRL